ncbi:MAG: ABC transporter substrate-binding protein [bacterium]|nr:ABC transporter substrate-binding protein [bacterium]
MKYRNYLLTLIVVAGIAATVLFNRQVPQNAAPDGGQLVIGTSSDFEPFNPVITCWSVSSWINDIIYDGLVRLDRDNRPQPCLASSWSVSSDGRTWTFLLRPGVLFHDGRELTSAHVVFTYRSILDPKNASVWAADLGEVYSIAGKGPYKVVFKLKSSFAPFIYAMRYGVLPAHLCAGRKFDDPIFTTCPVGTGRYRLEAFTPGKSAVLAANDRYFRGRPHIDKIIFKRYQDLTTLWSGLEAGDIDWMDYGLTAEDFNRVKRNPHLRTYSYNRPYYYSLVFNMRRPLFQDLRLRQAISMCIDRKVIVDKALLGQGAVCRGPYSPVSWANDPHVGEPVCNPGQAVRILRSLGWSDADGNGILDKNGRELAITLLYDKGNDIKDKSALLIQQQLAEVGIKLNIVCLEVSVLINNYMMPRNFDILFIEAITVPDPSVIYRTFHSSKTNDGLNFSSYNNLQADKLIMAGRRAKSEEDCCKAYRALHRLLADDLPVAFLFHLNELVGINRYFKGVSPCDQGMLWNIEEWYIPKQYQTKQQ